MPNLENLARLSLARSVNATCRKIIRCQYCNAVNGTVKKAGPIKIIHDQFRAKKSHDARRLWEGGFIIANKVHKEVGAFMNNILDDLNPLKVLDIFRRITNEVHGFFIIQHAS